MCADVHALNNECERIQRFIGSQPTVHADTKALTAVFFNHRQKAHLSAFELPARHNVIISKLIALPRTQARAEAISRMRATTMFAPLNRLQSRQVPEPNPTRLLLTFLPLLFQQRRDPPIHKVPMLIYQSKIYLVQSILFIRS